jgi:glycosyltransferase involved in cell wall biosynthesis
MSWGYDLIVDAGKNALWGWLTRFTLRRSAAMLGDSAIVRRLARSYGMPDERIVTFPWGVDLNHFCPSGDHRESKAEINNYSSENEDLEPSNLQPSTFNLLSTRGWEPIYGVEVIARAFVEAARKRPELRLTMLGNGSLAGQLRRIFQAGGVLERVAFPGQAAQADLPRYYRSADLYVSASHSDGASISLLEALACGRPALVSDIPGNREWITPGVEGWWFPDGDAGALAEAILRAVQERERLPEMGRSARRLAEARADWQKNFREISRLYELALHPQGLPRLVQ